MLNSRASQVSTRSTLIALSLASSCLGSAVAAEDSGDWAFQLTPYAWATDIRGDMTPFRGAHRVKFSSSFSQLLQDLDAAVFLSGSVRRDRFVILGDFSFAKSSKFGHLASGVKVKGEVDQTSMTLVSGFQAIRTPSVGIDIMAGARHWLIKAKVAVPAAGEAVSPRLTFTDPILAMQANVALAPRWSAHFYGDFGGFGVGSRQTSQLLATLRHEIRDDIFISAGFRTLSFDYRKGGSDFDLTMSGPLIGASWRF